MSAVDDAEEVVRAAVPQVAAEVLASLRWGPDQLITNYEGERVWLKQVWYDEPVVIPGCFGPSGEWRPPISCPGYITDCCFAAAPCERHR